MIFSLVFARLEDGRLQATVSTLEPARTWQLVYDEDDATSILEALALAMGREVS